MKSTIQAQREEALRSYQSGQHAKASDLCLNILKSEPDDVDALHFLAKIAYAKEAYSTYVFYMRKVHSQLPSDNDILIEYCQALRLSHQPDNAIDILQGFMESDDSLFSSIDREKYHPFYLELGLSLAGGDDLARARKILLKALHYKPDCIFSLKRLGWIANQKNHYDEAINFYEKVTELHPDNIHAYPELIKAHLRNRTPETALALCDKCLTIEPSCTGLLAFKYIALSELGDKSGAQYFLDLKNYIKRISATCPSSYKNITDLNTEFTQHILHHTEKTSTPELYTTVHGWQTQNGKLFAENKSLGDAVIGMINSAVNEYLSLIPDDPNHPVNVGRPTARHIEPWCVVLDHKGCQAPHTHPKSWLSGSYYIQLPDDFSSQTVADAGHIVFGQGEEQLHQLHKPVTKSYGPVEGEFVIFPSYYWHHTVPLESTNRRICMAFDIVPTKGWGK